MWSAPLVACLLLAASAVQEAPASEPRPQGPLQLDTPGLPEPYHNWFSLSLAYIGEMLIHPGAALGLEAKVDTWRIYRLALGLSLGGYVHPQNHGALYTLAEIIQRWVSPMGLYGEVLAGLGYLHQWPDGEVWERDPVTGTVGPTSRGGRPYLMMSTALGLGWELDSLSPFVRAQLFGIFPYNRALAPRVALQVGVLYGL